MSDRQKDGGISVDSEDLSQCSNYESVTKGSDGDTGGADHDSEHSDYGDESRRDFQPLDSADEEHADENEEDNDSDSVIVEDEREDGDGQESLPSREKKLDDDEDRRNPQYIPKKGTFYEHDDRTADDGEPGKEREGKEGVKDREGKEVKEPTGRKIWKEKEDRWKHDRFQETEQMPKSKEELLMVYGYDIRNEESPPKARRRRRYGRGPNKYTRSWEDEAAYGRPLGAFIVEKEGGGPVDVGPVSGRGRRKGPPSRGSDPAKTRPPKRNNGPRRDQDFPALTPGSENAPVENGQKPKAEALPTSFSSKVGGDSRVAGSFKMNPRDVIAPFRNQPASPSMNSSQESRQEKGNVPPPHQQAPHYNNKSEDGHKRNWRRDDAEEGRRQGSGRIDNRPRPQSGGAGVGARRRSADWQDQNGQNRVANRGRLGRGGVPRQGENGNQSDGGSQNYADDVSKELGSLAITSAQHQQSNSGDYVKRHSNGNNVTANNGAASNSSNYRQAVVPPRMQESAGSRPKRYSSVRPRNMPEAGPGQGPVQSQPQGQVQGQAPAAGPGPGPSQGPTTVPVPVPGPVPGSVAGPVAGPGAGAGATPPPPPVTAPYTAPAHSYYQPDVVVAGYPQQIYADTTGQQASAAVVVEASAAPQMMVRPPQGVAGGMAPPFPAGFPQPPPTFMTPPPGPGARLLPGTGYMAPAAAPPPQPMPPQPLNFVPAPNAQGQFQSLAFQTYQPIAMVGQVTQPQPQEMYQRQSGITYYSPQNQAVPRAVPQPRVKAAIPIVPPPELALRHRNDEIDMSGEHDPGVILPSSSPSPSPGHMTLAQEMSGQSPCPSPPQTLAPAPAPPKTPSPPAAPFGAASQGLSEEQSVSAAVPDSAPGPAVALETEIEAGVGLGVACAPLESCPERAPQSNVAEEPPVTPA